MTFECTVLLYDKKDDAVEGSFGNGERSYRRLHGETELPQASKLISGETAETRFFKAQQLVNFNKNLVSMWVKII